MGSRKGRLRETRSYGEQTKEHPSPELTNQTQNIGYSSTSLAKTHSARIPESSYQALMAPPPHDIPADIFYEILLQYSEKNLAFLWLNCRPVFHNFKDAVERVFIAKHLKKTWLHVHIRTHL